MMRKKCISCCWAMSGKGGEKTECNYSLHHERSRTAQAYEMCGVQQATAETDALLNPYTCVFYERGERVLAVDSVVLPGSLPHCKPTAPRQPRKARYKTPEQFDFSPALEMHQAGKTAKEIAAVIGCSESTVYSWKVRNGLSKPMGSHFNEERAAQMFKAGATLPEVAKALGCSEGTALNYKKKAGLTKEPLNWERGFELFSSGASPQQIANELGCKRLTVLDWARREGLQW